MIRRLQFINIPLLLIIFNIFILFWVYSPLLARFFRIWHLGDNSYCYFVPLIFLYLCWEKRKEFPFHEISFHFSGILILIFSIFVACLGLLSAIDFFLYLSFWGSILALAVLIYGKRVWSLRFPFLILLFMVPLPPFIRRILTFKLQLLTSYLAAHMMSLVGIDILREGNIIYIGNWSLQVAEACSGLRYFMPLVLLALLISYYGLSSWWAWGVMLLAVIPVAVFSNALRVFITGLFVSRGNTQLLQDPYHSFLGWLTFIIALGMFLSILLILRKIEKTRYFIRSTSSDQKISSSKKHSFWLAIIFAIVLLIGGTGFRLVPQLSVRSPSRPLAYFPLKIGPWYGEPHSLSPRILESLWADDYFYALYKRDGFEGIIFLFIPYYAYQTTWHTIHTPQSCLLGGGWSPIKTGIWKVRIFPEKNIPVRYLWLVKKGQYLLATYFFLERGRVLVSPWKHKIYLFEDALLKRRTDGALVRVELLCPPGMGLEKAKKEIKEFIRFLWPNLLNFIPQD